MLPFAEKIEAAQSEGAFDELDDESPLAFLKEWKGKDVVPEEQVSQITEPGREDAFGMGKRMRHLYGSLLPPKDVGKGKGKGQNITVSYGTRLLKEGSLGSEWKRMPSTSAQGGQSADPAFASRLPSRSSPHPLSAT